MTAARVRPAIRSKIVIPLFAEKPSHPFVPLGDQTAEGAEADDAVLLADRLQLIADEEGKDLVVEQPPEVVVVTVGESGPPGPIGPVGPPGTYGGAVAESSPDPVLLFDNALI